jgi:hypothetical protein
MVPTKSPGLETIIGRLKIQKNIDKNKAADQSEPRTALLGHLPPENSQRLFSPPQLKSIIKDLVKSKVRKDNNYLLSGLPFVTMKEHLSHFSQKRFGIRKLIRQFEHSFLASLHHFATTSVDAHLFLHVIDNRISEDFHKVLDALKRTVRDLFSELFGSKYSSQHRLQKEISIEYSDGAEILELLYEANDAQKIAEALKKACVIDEEQQTNIRMKPGETVPQVPRVSFKMFESVLLRFAVDAQVEFLENFSMIFRSFDEEAEGKIDEETFRKVMTKIGAILGMNLDSHSLMVRLDPSGTGVFTYTGVVSLFSMHFQKTEVDETSFVELLNKKIKG